MKKSHAKKYYTRGGVPLRMAYRHTLFITIVEFYLSVKCFFAFFIDQAKRITFFVGYNVATKYIS